MYVLLKTICEVVCPTGIHCVHASYCQTEPSVFGPQGSICVSGCLSVRFVGYAEADHRLSHYPECNSFLPYVDVGSMARWINPAASAARSIANASVSRVNTFNAPCS